MKKINSHIYSDYFYYDHGANYGLGLYYFSLEDFFHQAENIQKKLKIKRNIQVLKNNIVLFHNLYYYRNKNNQNKYVNLFFAFYLDFF